MFLIFLLWTATLDLGPSSSSNEQTATTDNSSGQPVKNDLPSLWQTLRAGVGDLFNSFNSATSTGSVDNQNQIIIDNSNSGSANINNDVVPPAALP